MLVISMATLSLGMFTQVVYAQENSNEAIKGRYLSPSERPWITVNSNKKVCTYVSPSWQKVSGYYVSWSRNTSISLSFGYGPISVSFDAPGGGGYYYSANYKKYSRLKGCARGYVRKRLSSGGVSYQYDFVEKENWSYVEYK